MKYIPTYPISTIEKSSRLSPARNRYRKVVIVAASLAVLTTVNPITQPPVFAQQETQVAAITVDLFQIVRTGDLSRLESVLSKEIDVNLRDAEGKTPLMWAASLGRTDMVKALTAKGADVNALDQSGHAALHYVLAGEKVAPPKKKKKSFGKMFGQVASIGTSVLGGMLGGGLMGGLPLMGGLAQNLLGQSLPSLLGGKSFNPASKSGWNAVLGSALSSGTASHLDLRNLTEGGGKIPDASTWTGLLQSAGKNDPRIIQAMGNLGANVSPEQQANWNAFLEAASKGDTKTTQELLNDGKLQSVLEQASQGLQAASSELPGRDGGVGIVQILLEKGANPALADKDGNTAQKWAQQRGLKEIAALLQPSDNPKTNP